MFGLTPEDREVIRSNGIEAEMAAAKGVDEIIFHFVYTRISANGLSSLAVEYTANNGHTIDGIVKINDGNRAGLREESITILGAMADARSPVIDSIR